MDLWIAGHFFLERKPVDASRGHRGIVQHSGVWAEGRFWRQRKRRNRNTDNLPSGKSAGNTLLQRVAGVRAGTLLNLVSGSWDCGRSHGLEIVRRRSISRRGPHKGIEERGSATGLLTRRGRAALP